LALELQRKLTVGDEVVRRLVGEAFRAPGVLRKVVDELDGAPAADSHRQPLRLTEKTANQLIELQKQFHAHKLPHKQLICSLSSLIIIKWSIDSILFNPVKHWHPESPQTVVHSASVPNLSSMSIVTVTLWFAAGMK
jgi:hypothetical protein